MVTVEVKFLLSSGEASGIMAHTFRKSLLEGIHIMYRMKKNRPSGSSTDPVHFLVSGLFQKVREIVRYSPSTPTSTIRQALLLKHTGPLTLRDRVKSSVIQKNLGVELLLLDLEGTSIHSFNLWFQLRNTLK